MKLKIPERIEGLPIDIRHHFFGQPEGFLTEEFGKPVILAVKPAARLNALSVFRIVLPRLVTSSAKRLLSNLALIISISAGGQLASSGAAKAKNRNMPVESMAEVTISKLRGVGKWRRFP